MDFWIITGIVLLICAIIDLPFFIMELREDQRRKQEHSANTLQKEPEGYTTVGRKPLRGDPFTLEYHFRNRQEKDLDQINADLAKYELSELELVNSSGYLATVTRTDGKTGEVTVRYWYGLDDCVLRCTPAKPGMGQYYQINTMTMEKTVWDCAALWRQGNPDRAMRTMVQISFAEAYAIIVLHHKKGEPDDVPTFKPAAPVRMLEQAAPVPSEKKTKYCCGRPGKDTLSFWYEKGTLYIEGQGRLRCGQWPWLRAPIRHVVIGPGCTAIGDFAFLNCSSLETIVLPDTLRTIGERAFAHCVHLQEVTIPDSVTGIGKGAFFHCDHLKQVRLPRNLTQIHPNTFRYCKALQDVQIPDSVHYIGTRAFYKVKSVKNLPQNLGNWGTRTREFSKRKYGLGEGAFAHAGLPSHIEIPSGVCTLPRHAFCGCETLAFVRLPRYAVEIGDEAFDQCSGLTNVVLPSRLKKIGKRAFYNCVNLASVTFPHSLTEIGADAFRKCKSMDSLELPNSVTKVGSGAFAESGIVNAVLSRNIPWIPKKFFCNCRDLQHVVLPDGITGIGESALDGCVSLREVEIPDTVTWIGERAFHSCAKLTAVKLPENLARLHAAAFACCAGLTEMVIPSGITGIPRSAFACCTGLVSVTIPDSVREIEIWGFTDCTSLKSLYIPQSVEKIGLSAFERIPHIVYHGTAESSRNWGALSRNGCSGNQTQLS